MSLRIWIRSVGLAVLITFAAIGCGRKSGILRPWPSNTDPIVFQDNFTGLVEFWAFGGSYYEALSTDTFEEYDGSGCVRVVVPGTGPYAGGAFTTITHTGSARARDLSGYNTLALWGKASRLVTIKVGLGNNNTGTSKFEASRKAIRLTPTWTRFVIPIPLPSKLTAEQGLFFFAADPQPGATYDIWFDDVQFETDTTISNPRPSMTPLTKNTFVGATEEMRGTKVTFSVGTDSAVVDHMPGYFTYASSNPAVATVTDGRIQVTGVGTAIISAQLGAQIADGTVTLSAAEFTPGLAPRPTVPAGDVISLFSNAYTNRYVDRWSTDWDRANVADLGIFGNDMKWYTSLLYAGIEFTSQPIDASAMKDFHMDIWAPTAPTALVFKVKLVDFGANAVYGGGDDSEHELTFDASYTPPVIAGSWVGLDIPLANFMNNTTGLLSRAHLAQLIISSNTSTVYVDNVYFHR